MPVVHFSSSLRLGSAGSCAMAAPSGGRGRRRRRLRLTSDDLPLVRPRRHWALRRRVAHEADDEQRRRLGVAEVRDLAGAVLVRGDDHVEVLLGAPSLAVTESGSPGRLTSRRKTIDWVREFEVTPKHRSLRGVLQRFALTEKEYPRASRRATRAAGSPGRRPTSCGSSSPISMCSRRAL